MRTRKVDPKVSVIIADCDIEPYLDQCLRSITSQTLKDIEIVLIDTGSSQKSSDSFHRFAEADDRIRILYSDQEDYHQQMSLGMHHARGEYIGFVTSAVMPEPNMFETLFLNAKRYNADVIKSNYYMLRIYPCMYSIYDEVFKDFPYYKNLPEKSRKLLHLAEISGAGLYRRESLLENSFCFNKEEKADQNASFDQNVCMEAERIILIPNALWNYRCDNDDAPSEMNNDKSEETENIKFSIIVIVDSDTCCLKECLGSYYAQSYTNYELFCVGNDISKEQRQIIDTFTSSDERFHYREAKSNHLAEILRDTIEELNGEYCIINHEGGFADCEMLQLLQDTIISSSPDIIGINGKRFVSADGFPDLKANTFVRHDLLPKTDSFSPKEAGDHLLRAFDLGIDTKCFKLVHLRNVLQKYAPKIAEELSILSLLEAKGIGKTEESIFYRVVQNKQHNAFDYVTKEYLRTLFDVRRFALKQNLGVTSVDDLIKYSSIQSLKKGTYQTRIDLLEILNSEDSTDDLLQKREGESKADYLLSSQLREALIMFNKQMHSSCSCDEEEMITRNDSNDRSVKISVIIPVYNVERYIDATIESIVTQTLKDIEIILIDDASTDSSLNILRQWEAKDARIRLIRNKKNQGQSHARNAGLRLANGEYILFIDGDDLLKEESLEVMYSTAKKNSLDVLFYSADVFYDEDCTNANYQFAPNYRRANDYSEVLSGPGLLTALNENKEYIMSPCMSISRSVFLCEEGIRFLEGIIHEDNLYTFELLMKAKRASCIKDSLYIRRIRPDSTMTRPVSFDNAFGYYSCAMHMINVYLDSMMCMHTKEKEAAAKVIASVIRSARKQYSKLPDDKKGAELGLIAEYPLFAAMVNDYDEKLTKTRKNKNEKNKEKKLKKNSAFKIASIEISKDHQLQIEGVFQDSSLLEEKNSLRVISNAGEIYPVFLTPAPMRDVLDSAGNRVTKAYHVQAEIPVKYGEKYRFAVKSPDKTITLNPGFTDDVLLTQELKTSYILRSDCIIKYNKCRFGVYQNRIRTHLASYYRLRKELEEKRGQEKVKTYYEKYLQRIEIEKLKLKNRVCFFTSRSNTDLRANVKSVYEKCKLPKIALAKMVPLRKEDVDYLAREMFSSKIVVFDDYNHIIRRFSKKKGQKYIQLWHAAGAFKKFGLDVNDNLPSIERKYHADYDLVCVSSEYVRGVYAQAFGVPEKVVQALGIPRTDDFFDENLKQEIIQKVYTLHPLLQGKSIILYAPTFRNAPGQIKNTFVPELDFDELSKSLPEGHVFVICPHPVMKVQILKKQFDNIIEIRDIPTHNMIFTADLLVTDYSSIIFDYSLLDKPIAFYCYDYDEYNRDFYLDYETELPGEIFKTQEAFLDYLSKGEFEVSPKMQSFKDKYMSACDGHSTERISAVIDAMMKEK